MMIEVKKTSGKTGRTRRLLVEAAWELFEAQGYEGTTVEQITEKAGVSRRTFFRYFPTKEAVVFFDQETEVARWRGTLAEFRKTLPPFEAIRAACLEFADDYSGKREWLLRRHKVLQASDILIARDVEFDHLYELAVAETLIDGPAENPMISLQAKVLAGAAFGAIRATLRTWYESGCETDLARMGQVALNMLQFGIGSLSDLIMQLGKATQSLDESITEKGSSHANSGKGHR